MSNDTKMESLAMSARKAVPLSGWSRLLRHRELSVLYAIAALCVLIQFRNPHFATLFNFQVMLRQLSIFGLIALAEMIVIITAGIDLSVGALVAFVGVVEAMLVSRAGWPPLLALGSGLVAAVLVGVYHGVAVSRWSIPAFIITLGSLSIWRGLATGITRSYPILIADENLRWIGQGIVWGFPVPLLILAVVSVTLVFVLNSTSLGRNIYAVGGNIEAARLSGIPVTRVLIATYTMASLIVGVAGVIVAGRMAQGLPSVGGGYELNAIAAAIIGGTSFFGGVGTVPGVLLGSALMVVIDNSLILMDVSAYWYTLVVGTIIVLAVTIDVVSTNRRRRAEALMGI
jgi:ribose/xylose/arabinose/galactoside ABC-type transport system permease subunit